jgi:hypothetical protein
MSKVMLAAPCYLSPPVPVEGGVMKPGVGIAGVDAGVGASVASKEGKVVLAGDGVAVGFALDADAFDETDPAFALVPSVGVFDGTGDKSGSPSIASSTGSRSHGHGRCSQAIPLSFGPSRPCESLVSILRTA